MSHFRRRCQGVKKWNIGLKRVHIYLFFSTTSHLPKYSILLTHSSKVCKKFWNRCLKGFIYSVSGAGWHKAPKNIFRDKSFDKMFGGPTAVCEVTLFHSTAKKFQC